MSLITKKEINVFIPITAALFLSSLVLSCNQARGRSDVRQVSTAPSQQISKQDSEMTKEAAVRIAEETAKKAYGRLDQFTVIPCEQHAFWRIVFEPKPASSGSAGPEYVIDKRTGVVVGKRDLPLGDGISSELPPRSQKIDRERAIAIAGKDATMIYGSLSNYDLTACELTTTWRVVYSPRKGLNGGGPEYVVDKFSGNIRERKYYQ